MPALLDNLSTRLVNDRARSLKNLRALVMSQLFPSLRQSGRQNSTEAAVVQLANTFSRYAQTQTTYVDESGPTRTNTSGSANVMERQVSRAIAQVLGRAPGSSPTSFVGALNDAFPTMNNGKVSVQPSRSAVSLYGQSSDAPSQSGYSSANSGSISAGLMGQLSAEQATLYRQALTISADALRVLEGLHAFVPEAETDKIEALRALVRSEMNSLVEEFGRVDEPRRQRVETYFTQLRGPNGHLIQFGERAFLNRRRVTPATLDDEAQIAGYDLLVNYVKILREIWDSYSKIKPLNFPEFSLRLSRASVLLPVIAQGNSNLMSALDSIGFTEDERRSSASRFTTLETVPPKLSPSLDRSASAQSVITRTGHIKLPDITFNDLNEWIDRFSSLEAPGILADSGQYGLEFVTDQADQIFWVIVPILASIKSPLALNLSGRPIVAQALTHERVSWALDDLVNQLKALADLAA
jgi:hypothetical protein